MWLSGQLLVVQIEISSSQKYMSLVSELDQIFLSHTFHMASELRKKRFKTKILLAFFKFYFFN